MRPEAIGTITAAELKQRLDRGEALTVLDVREPDERAFCAIPVLPPAVDVHVPMREIQAHVQTLAQSPAPIVVYCHLGMRSLVVARWLASRGVAGVHNLEGGIDAWASEIAPEMPRY